VKQARDKEKKEKKEKTKEKEKEETAAPPPAAEAAATAEAEAEDEDKRSETRRDEPKKKIGNVFALFNQSQIQEFKEVCFFALLCDALITYRTTQCSPFLFHFVRICVDFLSLLLIVKISPGAKARFWAIPCTGS